MINKYEVLYFSTESGDKEVLVNECNKPSDKI